jgi:DNA-binding transcriptional ArsR family regulator
MESRTMTELNFPTVYQLSELFKSLSDPTRVRILGALAAHEQNVNDLADHLDISQSALSHQLRVLRGQRLVTFRRDGKNSIYRLQEPNIMHLVQVALSLL